MTGGGGGGGGAHPGDDTARAWGGGGGGGAATVSCTFNVRPGNALLINVGAGGAGGSIFDESAPQGGRSTATLPDRGSSAEGGYGGEAGRRTRSGAGGVGDTLRRVAAARHGHRTRGRR
uniref:glycine-rich domain-containing protein n=1 Tax=Microtetraspora niveoalba TaxID=46175 RepID=UPI0035714A7B